MKLRGAGVILKIPLREEGVFVRIMRRLTRRTLERLESRFLEGIGEPEQKGFEPSPFQRKALAALLQYRDVIVVAPTGSGKTWIAIEAMDRFLAEGRRCWYTTPLKALSNQKFDDFRRRFGPERVGLLTGERRENPSAPLIVATTEVLRNVLYRGEGGPDFVVLDEAHYLGDEDRGTTWEEVIILSPPESQLLLLSATISNVRELAGWMREVRGEEPQVVKADERPVPLRYGFLAPRGRVLPLEPKLVSKVRRSGKRPSPEGVLDLLEEKGLLPAIWFLPRRRDCDLVASRFGRLRWRGREERRRVFEEVARGDPYLWSHPLLEALIGAGVASHHAGHLTGWKVAVERMLARGLLRAVFATTTLAAGLDVPARTVVLTALGNGGDHPLTALEFQQMTGRAGRRGKDRVGFVLLIGRSRRDLFEGMELAEAEPEPLRSSFRLQYYQILNLLDRYDLEEATGVLQQSFLLYQIRSGRKRERVQRGLLRQFRRRADLLKGLGYLDEDYGVTEAGRWCLLLRHEYSLVLAELIRRDLYRDLSAAALAAWVGSLSTERAPRRLIEPVDLRPLAGVIFELEGLERKMRIPPMGLAELFQPHGAPSEAKRRAAAVRAWAEGADWRELAYEAEMEEGDLQRLMLQTAELLREMEDLPLGISTLAREARLSLLRSPIL
ncbi:MAG: ATP-dependent DNA helicase [Deltaproteobacteria bacterium]|nr:MAG: ATP-dependent DNA helicase [Deltaproteobacteria bacterium]